MDNVRAKFFRDCDAGVRDVVSQQELRQLTSSQVQQLWMVDLKTGGTQYVSEQDLTHLDAISAGKKRVFDGGRIDTEDRARINKQSRDARYAERSTLAAAKQARILSERAAQVSVTFQGSSATHQGRTRAHTWTGPRSANGESVSISRDELLSIASTVLDGEEKQFRVLVPSGQGYEELDAATGLHDMPIPASGAPPIIVQEIDPALRDAIVDNAPIDLSLIHI